MSQKQTLNTLLLALVLSAAIFVVAFMLFMFVADYRFMASAFLALLVALLAGIVLYLGFGTPTPHSQVSAAPTVPAPTPAAAPTVPSPTPAAAPIPAAAAPKVEEAAAEPEKTEFQVAAEEEAARMKAAEESAAAEAEAARVKAAEDAAAAEAAEKAAAEKAAADAAAKAAAEAEQAKADAAGIPDYDGDGKLEGTAEGTRPAGLDGPRNGTADNLKEIKGIGPKLEKLCNSLGFWHFDQVAAWTSDEVAWVDANLEGFKGRVTRDEWVAQAKVLAAGGETEFSKRVEDGDVY